LADYKGLGVFFEARINKSIGAIRRSQTFLRGGFGGHASVGFDEPLGVNFTEKGVFFRVKAKVFTAARRIDDNITAYIYLLPAANAAVCAEAFEILSLVLRMSFDNGLPLHTIILAHIRLKVNIYACFALVWVDFSAFS
jgi:hypothetical protein